MERLSELENCIIEHFARVGTQPDEIKKVSPNEWTGCLMQTQRTLYPQGFFYIHAPEDDNAFNYILNMPALYELCNEYILLCYKYNKIVHNEDYNYLSGIDSNKWASVRVFHNLDIDKYILDFNKYYKEYINITSNYSSINELKKDTDIYNHCKDIYNNKLHNIDNNDYIKYIAWQKLKTAKSNTYVKKLEGTGQAMGLMYLGNNADGYLPKSGHSSSGIISLESIQRGLIDSK